MPKVIPELRTRFIAAARKRLLETDEHDLTIRQIAEECRTGVGTVYNYFRSKDDLIVCVMTEDWKRMNLQIRERVLAGQSPLEDVRIIYQCLHTFIQEYRPVWEMYSVHLESVGMVSRHHPAVIQVLAEYNSQMIHKYSLEVEPQTEFVLAEIMLSMALHQGDQFGLIQPILCRILGIPKE